MIENSRQIEETGTKVSHILREVLVGLSRKQKGLPSKLLYDKLGSEIFEKICELKDYYPTRAEKEILVNHGEEIASMIGRNALIIEPGCGNGGKFKLLMQFLDSPAGYMPVEISREILLRLVGELDNEFPNLSVFPVSGDFSLDFGLPCGVGDYERRIIFFPGSTIGNFEPQKAVEFLRRLLRLTGPATGLLIGVDLKKDIDRMLRAYDDSDGVTAAFNLNLLNRLNRELDATFNPGWFSHQAIYNHRKGRVEMHLVSQGSQHVQVNQTVFHFSEGESIHTENSYKYTVQEFSDLCSKARLVLRKTWMDTEKLFCVYYFERNDSGSAMEGIVP